MAQHVGRKDWRGRAVPRLGFVLVLFTAWVLGVEARIFYLQVLESEWLGRLAEQQQERTITVPAPRGDILDRHGALLAYSVDMDTIGAVPASAGAPEAAVAKLCSALGDCSKREAAKLVERFRTNRTYALVRRKVPPEQAKRVRQLDLEWVVWSKEPRRFYPNVSLAAHLLGYVGLDDVGLGGLENAYDQRVKGRPGKLLVQRDVSGRAFSSNVGQPAVPGAILELTVDRHLQYIAERELRAGVVENRAQGGSAIILDPKTGEILALANEPTFNPNVYWEADASRWRNRAIQDIYEPGSTFKMVTASAALETGTMRSDELIDTGNGVIRVGSRVVDEYEGHRYGVLSLTDVMVKSSNVGAIKVGFRVGARNLDRYVRLFGFGTRLSRDFRGENAGLVWPLERSESTLMSVSMGYEIGVTPLQMATAASAIANGGEMVEPRVLRAVIEGNRRTAVQPRVLRRVISPKTAAAMTAIMEQVVERGTAKAARVEGYTIAGKTGTAAKLVGRYYSKSDYNASFVGFLPSRDPRLTILVVIDTPRGRGYAGGVVAAPIFKRIAEASLRYLAIPPAVNPLAPLLVERHRRVENVKLSGPPPAITIGPVEGPLAEGQTRLPELRGFSGREAVKLLARMGITARLSGDGLVVDQSPPPGTPMDPGSSCRLSLARESVSMAGLQP
jgi:cell division protein FtsI (penicillin-binding protein 3)